MILIQLFETSRLVFIHFYINFVLSSTKVIIRPLKTAIIQGKNYFKNFFEILFSIVFFLVAFVLELIHQSSGGFKFFIQSFNDLVFFLFLYFFYLLLSTASKIWGFFFMLIFCNESLIYVTILGTPRTTREKLISINFYFYFYERNHSVFNNILWFDEFVYVIR